MQEEPIFQSFLTDQAAETLLYCPWTGIGGPTGLIKLKLIVQSRSERDELQAGRTITIELDYSAQAFPAMIFQFQL